MLKRLSIIVLLLLHFMCIHASNVDTLAIFNLNSYEGWKYNNPTYELNRTNISQLHIRLFKSNQGVDYTLVSPQFDCSGFDSLIVNVDYITNFTSYQVNKVPLTFTITDVSGNVVASQTVDAQKSIVEQKLNVCLPIHETGLMTLSLAALKADLNNNGAVRTVVVRAVKGFKGDVNRDGVVDVDDVNAIINIILDSSVFDIHADVNGDGMVDVDDVNEVINLILGQ